MVDSFTFLVVASFSAFMFCPLCKAEYRHGFSTCSDWRIPLVATEAEAAAVEVDRLWTGDDRKKFESILDVLLDAGIPFPSRESLKSRPWPWISIFLHQFMRPRPTSEYGIDVFHSDRDRADAAIPKTKSSNDYDDEDD
jgi:hypothetical protein